MTISGIHINKYIRKWLTENPQVTEMVDRKNIVPLVISPASQPFITFQHGPIEPDYSKAPDGLVVDSVEVLIAVVATDYEQSVDIAQAVRSALEMMRYSDDYIYIPVMEIISIEESVVKDNYVQEITVSFQIQPKN